MNCILLLYFNVFVDNNRTVEVAARYVNPPRFPNDSDMNVIKSDLKKNITQFGDISVHDIRVQHFEIRTDVMVDENYHVIESQ